jgi:hypothetical protein
MDTTNPINLQLEAKQRLKAKIVTIQAMLNAALADLTAAAYAETCFLDDHIDDLGDHPNRVGDGISNAATRALSALGDTVTVINEWGPAVPGVRVASPGE